MFHFYYNIYTEWFWGFIIRKNCNNWEKRARESLLKNVLLIRSVKVLFELVSLSLRLHLLTHFGFLITGKFRLGFKFIWTTWLSLIFYLRRWRTTLNFSQDREQLYLRHFSKLNIQFKLLIRFDYKSRHYLQILSPCRII